MTSNNTGCFGTNNNGCNRCNHGRTEPNIPKLKTQKKPTFIGYNNDKIKAMLADKPRLEPLNAQLKQFKKDVISYASASMSGYVSQAMEELTSFDFDPLMSKPVNFSKCMAKTMYDEGDEAMDECPDLKVSYKVVLRSNIVTYTNMAKHTHHQVCHIHGTSI